jgi:hypothetical protein
MLCHLQNVKMHANIHVTGHSACAWSPWRQKLPAKAGGRIPPKQVAQTGNSVLSGFRKSVSGFWNTQTLERVHLKWRQ